MAFSSASSSSIYSTAEEDFDTDTNTSHTHCPQNYFKCPSIKMGKMCPGEKIDLVLNKPESEEDSSLVIINNQRFPSSNSKIQSQLDLEAIPGAEINQFESNNKKPSSSACAISLSSVEEEDHTEEDQTEEEEDVGLTFSKFWWNESGIVITAEELQKVFNVFKRSSRTKVECERWLIQLETSQSRNDFQWAVHQLGGFNALLFLYARVVELFDEDAIQAKALSLALNQLKYYRRNSSASKSSTTTFYSDQYNLLRFILANESSVFGFKTFLILVQHSLTPSGNKLIDYDLLDICLLSSWRSLVRARCSEGEAPTGRRSLFECLLTVILDLLLEKNAHRSINIALLKNQKFSDKILAICCNIIFECKQQQQQQQNMNDGPTSSSGTTKSPLSSIDALRICALIKSIFCELTAPPDAGIATSMIKSGLYPLLPKECPSLPRREDCFFVYSNNESRNNSRRGSLFVKSGEDEDVFLPRSVTPTPPTNSNGPEVNKRHHHNVILLNQDIPDVVFTESGGGGKEYNKDSFETSQFDSFRETFHESLIEALMSVLLNTLAILPDSSFFTVLSPNLNSHLLLAFASHPNVSIKILVLKLICSYLSRVKNPVMTEFLKKKGFFLLSLYIQEDPGVVPVITQVTNGFGPIAYPLMIGMLHCDAALSTILRWIQDDDAGSVPCLISLGIIPSILNKYGPSTTTGESLPRQLNSIIFRLIHFCVLSPKEEPWKNLFCPSMESASHYNPNSFLVSYFYQEAISLLVQYEGKDVKKKDVSDRLLWLVEKAIALGEIGGIGSGGECNYNFHKWLCVMLATNVMELQAKGLETSTNGSRWNLILNSNNDEEIWRYFTKKNGKKLSFLMGLFLCKIFVPNKESFLSRQKILTALVHHCPNLKTWLPSVLKADGMVVRCFITFFRVFLTEARNRSCGHHHHPGMLMVECTETPPDINCQRGQNNNMPDLTGNEDEDEADCVAREEVESILINSGFPVSPLQISSTFSADFKKFKILLEPPPFPVTHYCGVSYQELRNCCVALEKMRLNLIPSLTSFNSSFSSSSTNYHLETQLLLQQKSVNEQKLVCCSARHFDSIFYAVEKFSMEVVVSVSTMIINAGVECVQSICTSDADVSARASLWELVETFCHPKAPWHFPELYPRSWALDQTEGPGRMRLRLQREHLHIPRRFVMPKHRAKSGGGEHGSKPFDFLFTAPQENDNEDFTSLYPFIRTTIKYMGLCARIIPGEEIPGEILLTADSLYFFPDVQKNKSPPEVPESIPLTCLDQSFIRVLRRRYSLEDKAAEIFVDNRNYFYTFRSFKEREEFISHVANVVSNSQAKQRDPSFKPAIAKVNNAITILNSNMNTMTQKWMKGLVSNFDYLMYLNTLAGRTYCDLMQYPVFPFVVSKYDTPTLHLHSPDSFRDLRRPMAIQDPGKEEHFKNTYNYLLRECDTPPFHYGSHYSNSGVVLHYLIRLPPYTQHFLKYQDGNFDIPDRSFHSMNTTWRLAAIESNTDFKEAIPEFYYLPEFLQNLQQFDLGLRQNGCRVGDVELPPWAKGDARLFVLINRQALESNHVRKCLHDWIDLVFGYKQTGKAAVAAMNVFHPSTYEGFDIEGVGDELLKKARRAMVSTYGQTPKQLFTSQHPRSLRLSAGETCKLEVLDTVCGIKWGNFLGSPTSSSLEIVNTREYREEMSLFETSTRVVFWPKSTLIMGDVVVGTWTSNEIQIKCKVVHMSRGDEITTCTATEDTIWIGHQSGRITVLKMIGHTVSQVREFVGHYKPIKGIYLNPSFSIAISCAGENYALIWDMNRLTNLNIIQLSDSDSIDSVSSSGATGDIAVVCKESNTVTLASINGFIIGTVCPEETIVSACLSSLDPGRNVNLLAVGCDYGYIRFYSTWDLKPVNETTVTPFASLPIQRIRYSKDGRRLYCLSTNDVMSMSAALQLPDSP